MSTINRIKKALSNPGLTMHYLLTDHLRRWEFRWLSDSKDPEFRKKRYKDYDHYLSHQKAKLDTIKNVGLPDYDKKYSQVLYERIQDHPSLEVGTTVLCLAARIGTEVKAFLKKGCFAVGVDLAPGQDNPFVVYSDFHNLNFADNSVDVIFTNSLDHTFDFSKLITEIKRVLKRPGHLILEIVRGEDEGYSPGYYEATIWKKIEDVLEKFKAAGFEVQSQQDFEYPWGGQHVRLTLQE